jgi:hypothetical protein
MTDVIHILLHTVQRAVSCGGVHVFVATLTRRVCDRGDIRTGGGLVCATQGAIGGGYALRSQGKSGNGLFC